MNENNIITLYHGSQKIIERPLFSFGKTNNDYGRGFYCTKDKNLAGEWACQKGSDGFINQYELDTSELKTLYLNNKKHSIFHWLTVLVENRLVDDIENDDGINFLKKNYHINLDNYDLIIGWRADDSYYTFTRDFVNDQITLQSLEKAMRLGKLGTQIVLKSEKAFSSIKFIETTPAKQEIYYGKFAYRDNDAREAYRKIRREPKSKGLLLTEIIKNPQLLKEYEKSKSDDFSLTR